MVLYTLWAQPVSVYVLAVYANLLTLLHSLPDYSASLLQADELMVFVMLVLTASFLHSCDSEVKVYLSGSQVTQNCSLPFICFWCVGSSNGGETSHPCCGWGLILSRARCIDSCQCPPIQREANEPFGKGSCLAHAVSYAETDMMQVLCIILAPMLLQQTEKCPPHSIIKLGVFFHNCCIVTNFNKMWIKILGWDVFLVWCKLCVNKLYLAHIINGWCTGLLSNTITNISMFSCLQCLQKAMDVPIFTKQCISDISKIYR